MMACHHTWTHRGVLLRLSTRTSSTSTTLKSCFYSLSGLRCPTTVRRSTIDDMSSMNKRLVRRARWDCSPTTRAMSTRAAPSEARRVSDDSVSPQHWKILYRAFLLRVHPDFFHDLPAERAVNEKNLQALAMHLEQRDHTPIPTRRGPMVADRGARLVFFLKMGSSAAAAVAQGNIQSSGQEDASGVAHQQPRPKKVMLPLQSHRNSTKLELRHLLHAAGVALPSEIPNPPLPSFRHRGESTNATTPFGWDEDGDDADWAEDLFGGTAANRAWDRAHGTTGDDSNRDHNYHGAKAKHRRWDGGASYANSGDFSNGNGHHYRHQQRAGESRTSEAGSPDGLAHVLATEAGRALVRERRGSARNVRRLVDELQEQYGFGEFTFRWQTFVPKCGWSKANLSVALGSLLKACATHRGAFRTPRFGGLDVVFRNDPSVLHKGEIRLSPADVPLMWVSVLQGITSGLLAKAEERARELVSLEKEASAIIRGAGLSRGLSCSKSRYHDFLSGLCSAEGEHARLVGQESTGLARGDWSELRCRVEEGFGRFSKVLEDGTIQIGTDMTLATVWKCLEQDFSSASAVTAESRKLAAIAETAAKRCRETLGLEAIDRGPWVSFAQMAAACDGLRDFCEGRGKGGDGRDTFQGSDEAGEEAAAVRNRLRGHCVMIVGERHGAVDGVTEDGEIAIRWDYWARGKSGEEGRGTDSYQSSSSPF